MAESENVKLVRRVYELFNALDPDPDVRRGSEGAQELMALFDPQVEFIQPPGALDSKTHEGSQAFNESWDEWLTVWSRQRARIDEIEERDSDVLVLGVNNFTGREGIEVQVNGGSIFTIVDGRIVRMQAFFDVDEARRAFELSE
jgi:ketosteroid isomerase-like protein